MRIEWQIGKNGEVMELLSDGEVMGWLSGQVCWIEQWSETDWLVMKWWTGKARVLVARLLLFLFSVVSKVMMSKRMNKIGIRCGRKKQKVKERWGNENSEWIIMLNTRKNSVVWLIVFNIILFICFMYQSISIKHHHDCHI